MRRRLVDSYTDPDTSITYGLRGSPVDFALAQTYTHDHVKQATRDFLTKGAGAAVVEGFDYTLAGQLKLSIAAGRAYDAAGIFYETITDPANQPTVVTLDAADPAQPRIDLVYAVLEAGVQAVPVTRMFRRVASEAELTANGGRNPYLPQPIERFAEEHARARVLVRKGVAGAVPVAPAANAGEVPLFQVRVNAGAAVLIAGNVTDVRQQSRSLAQAWAQIDTNTSKLNGVAAGAQVNVLESVTGAGPIGVSAVAGKNQNITISAATGAAAGSMSAADKSKLDASTSAATANALAQRDANGDASFRRVMSTIATGTSPLAVSSTTEVTNLNANMVQGQNLANLDTRYVNATGDSMTGLLSVDVGTPAHSLSGIHSGVFRARGPVGPNTPVRGLVGIAEVAGVNGADPGTVIGVHGVGHHLGGPGNNNAVAYGVYGEIVQDGIPLNPSHFAVYGSTGGATGANQWAGYFHGKLHSTGNFTASSKNFIIDHPLNPTGKDLVHGNVESSEYLLLYRLTVVLNSGEAWVDLDEAFGLTHETLSLLATDLKVYSAYGPGGAPVDAQIESAAGVSGGERYTLTVTGLLDGAVNLIIAGRRQDPYIALDPWVDEDGALIPEHNKRIATAAELGLLTPVTEEVPVGDPRVGQTLDVIQPQLIGAQGFKRHPTVGSGGSVMPKRAVTYAAEE